MRLDCPEDARDDFAAAKACAAGALRARDRPASLDREAWRAAAQFGLFQRLLPAGFTSGTGHGAVDSAGLLEAMGRGGAERGLLFAMGAHLFGCLAPLIHYGTLRQRAEREQPLRDRRMIGALAITESGGNSTFDNIATEAVPAPGGYRLTGEKTLVTNAPAADARLSCWHENPADMAP